MRRLQGCTLQQHGSSRRWKRIAAVHCIASSGASVETEEMGRTPAASLYPPHTHRSVTAAAASCRQNAILIHTAATSQEADSSPQ